MKGEIFTGKRILAIMLAWVILFLNVGEQFICHAEGGSQPLSEQTGGYTVTRHLLSDGANDVTDAGDAVYSNIADDKVTVDSIRAKGGKYAKCKPEEQVKGKIEKEYYYKLSFENQVGGFASGGYYDNKKQHHGAVHLVEKCYKKYQVYSQVYSYTVTNDEARTVDYYYFIYLWWELVDDTYHKSSDEDYLTYCLQYGTSISKKDAAYAKEKQTYDTLTKKEKYKVACAIYYGPHRAKDGEYYSTLKKKPASGVRGYDPSTWNKTMWLRYAATQFYIWTVTDSAKFSHADAVATAKQFDKDYATENESCYQFYSQLKAYAENAARLPEFMSDNNKAVPTETLSLQADGSYAVTLQDTNAMLKTGAFACDNQDVKVQVVSDKTLILNSKKQIASANLTFQKAEQVPDGNGLWYYANSKSQNMVDAVVSVTDCFGYLDLQTSDTDDTPIRVHKQGAATGKSYAGAGYAVFTSWKSAAVYDPVTQKTMVDDKGNTLKASDYIAGLIYQKEKGQPWSFTTYSAAKETALKNAGCQVKTLYHLAYYVKKGYTSDALPGTYCITTDETGWASTGKIKRRVTDGEDVTYYGYYMIEYQAPVHCDLAYPVTLEKGSITGGTCCLKWNTPEDYNQSAKIQMNTEHTGGLKIYKYEAESMVPLQDVVFHIFEDAECTRLYREVSTGEDGYALVDGMAPGIYYVQENCGQAIHVTDRSVAEVEVSSDAITVIDKSNTPIVVSIHLQKKADRTEFPDGFSPEDYSVAGAEYTLYAAEDITGSNGNVLFHKDALVYTMVCDDTGYAQVPEEFAKEHLRLGSYYVRETKAPYGYVLDETRYDVEAWNPEDVESEPDGDSDEFLGSRSVYNVWVDVAAEKPVTKSIRLHKAGRGLDCAGEWHTVDLTGAVFAVYCADRMRKDGLELTRDTYLDFPFGEEKYDGYRAIINDNPEQADQMVTDKEGNAETAMLPAGDYVVVEIKAPDGYTLADPIWVSLPEDAGQEYAYVEAEDRMLTGKIVITKTGDMPVGTQTQSTVYGTLCEIVFEKRALAGVRFSVYDENLQEIQRLTTKEDGTAVTRELPTGTYYVQESGTLNGLVLDREYYTARITQDKEYEVKDANVALKNDVMQTKIAVYKAGEEVIPSTDSGFSIAVHPMEGAVFGIYNKTDIFSADGSLLVCADTLMGMAVTDENGEAVMTAALLPGKYYYKELRTMEGYMIDTQSYEFTLSLTSNQPVERIEVNRETPLINRYYKAALRLHKVDGNNENLSLEGVEFGLYDAHTNECVGCYVTDKNGEISIEQMPFGAWYFKETKPLAGYQVDTNRYAFEITGLQQAVDLVVKNYPAVDLGYKEPTGNGIIFMCVLIGGLALAAFLCIAGRNNKERLVQRNAVQYKHALEEKGGETQAEALESIPKTEETENDRQKQRGSRQRSAQDADYDGVIDCLLEIPKINMCRVVVTGGNIEANLSNHYFTAARQSMIYGAESYVIFGHQSFTRGKGMNRLDELAAGDLIYISGKGFSDVYEITETEISESGEAIEDFTADNTHLALYTCKKQRERPKPYMIIRAVKRP